MGSVAQHIGQPKQSRARGMRPEQRLEQMIYIQMLIDEDCE
jgi:hypothetical protein